MTRLALVAAFVTALTLQPALGDEQYRTSILNIHGSPVQLNDCQARATDFTTSASSESLPNYYLNLGVNFTNTSTRALKDVQFAFTAFDASGAVLSTVHLAVSQDSAAGNVSMKPGSVTDLTGPKGWQGTNKTGKDHVSCSVSRVDYSDGTEWSSSTLDPTPSPQQPSPITIGNISFREDARNDFVSVNVTFTNEDTRTATAIRFSMTPLDAFGGKLWPTTQVADCIGTYSPGVRIEPSLKSKGSCGVFGIFAVGTVVSVHVEVVSVVFSDGTQWKAQQ